MRLFAGLDVSTQSTKLVVIDLDAVEVLHVDRVVYDEDLPAYGTRDGVIAEAPEGVSESDPGMWIEAVETVLGRLARTGLPQNRIRAIAVSGQQHGLVALDADGLLARPTSKLWNDFSTAGECEILTEAVGGLDAMIEEVGNSQRPGYTASKILHMKRHEPEAWARTATFLIVKDYVNWALTGGRVGGAAGPAASGRRATGPGGVRVTEAGDASGTALWSPVTGAWSERLIAAIDPGLADRLPPVRPSDRPIGRVGEGVAERFGLSRDCLVAPGSGDNMCAAIGTGNVREGIVTVSLGTSGTACTYRREPFVDPRGEIACYRDATGAYLPLLCVSNLANGYNEMLRLHGLAHGEFDRLVRRTPPGNGGRLLIPWYAGERTPDLPNAAPVYVGFDLRSLAPRTGAGPAGCSGASAPSDEGAPDRGGLGPLCRALLEGHVLNLHSGFGRMPLDPDEVSEIRLTGGLSRSEAWCQTIADVFDAEAVPVEGEGAALGAALSAAWVWLADAGHPVPIGEVVDPFVRLDEDRRAVPRPQHRHTYARLRDYFAAVSLRIRGLEAPDPFEARHRLLER